MVDRIPHGSRVNIHGCIRGDAWCDVSWAGDRGWVSSRYLEYLYRNHYVYLPDYTNVIDVPIVPFEIGTYWSTYYAGRPWYHRRAYWEGYWRSHERYAYQGPAYRTGRFGTAETRTGITEGRIRPGVTTGLAGRQGFVNERGEQGRIGREHGMQERIGREHGMQERIGREHGMQGRIGPERGANQALAHQQQPIVRGHEGNRFSAAPSANRAMHAQPSTVGRAGGPPMNAHAQQMGGGHGPAMPHGGGAPAQMGGGAPHMGGGGGGAAHMGGGGGGAPAGGPPGHQKH
jgi:hypothetical protein